MTPKHQEANQIVRDHKHPPLSVTKAEYEKHRLAAYMEGKKFAEWARGALNDAAEKIFGSREKK